MGKYDIPSVRRRLFLVTMTLIVVILYSGVIYGWTGIRIMLQDEGVYAGDGAAKQSAKLDIIMTVAACISAGCGIFVGTFLDRFGPRYTMAFCGFNSLAGCIIFGWGISYIVGYGLFALGGMGILIAGFRVGYVFDNHQALVIGLVSCLFDSSTVVFMLFQVLYEQGGLSMKQIFGGYAILTVILHSLLFLAWSLNKTYDARLESGDDGEGEEEGEDRDALDAVLTDDFTGIGDHEYHADEDDDEEAALDDEEDGTRVYEMDFWRQLKTPEFVFILIFCIIGMFRSNMFLGTMAGFMEAIGDSTRIYTKIIGYIVPIGFIFVPVVNWMIGNKGFAFTSISVTALGVAYGVTSCFNNVPIQLVTGFFYTFYRAALFSFVAAFTVKVFGRQTVGRITGLLYSLTAITILAQYPLVELSENTFHRNYQPVHIGLTILMGLVFIPVVWVIKVSREMRPPSDEDALRALSALDSPPSPASTIRLEVAHSVKSIKSLSKLKSSRIRSPRSLMMSRRRSGSLEMGLHKLDHTHMSSDGSLLLN